eukprot:SAG11_NODE_2439_length_3363_cov_1.689951_3_plen_82_part_00
MQDDDFSAWKESLGEPASARLCVLEIGAGQAVRTVKDMAESELVNFAASTLVRINFSAEVRHGSLEASRVPRSHITSVLPP